MSEAPTQRISTWREVCDRLTHVYNDIDTVGDDKIEVIVPVTVPEGDDVRKVTVRAIEVYGAPWIEALSTIGSARYVPPLASLARNFGVAVGATCVVEGALALRHIIPLDGLRIADLDTVVAAVAQQSADAQSGGPR